MTAALLDGGQLHALGWEIPYPFNLSVAGVKADTDIECQQLFRLLPGRRLVCLACYQEKQVLAKLFVHPGKAAIDYKRELQGYQYFTSAGIATPKLLESGRLHAAGFYALYEYLVDAVPLSSYLSATPDPASRDYLSKLIAIIARMHNADFQQVDLHFNNFLCTDSKLYTIDCGDVVPLSHLPVQKSGQMYKNYADILSQLPLVYDQLLPEFLQQYQLQLKGDQDFSLARMQPEIDVWRKWRLAMYLKKTARTCTEFISAKKWNDRRVYKRACSQPSWLEFFSRLDEQVDSGKRLKDGNSATVTLTECEGMSVVVKRYNIKNFKHLLSRCWRPSRAWRAWENAHRLKVLGIKTPQPIAVVEKRLGFLRHKAFYVAEYDPSPNALSVYAKGGEVTPQHLEDFFHLFSAMMYAGISHGDLKANNLLLTEAGIALIDLDAMTFHSDQKHFMKYFSKDMERFMRNWVPNKRAYAQFEKLIASLPWGKPPRL